MLSRFFLQTITPLYSIEPETFQKVVWDVPVPRMSPIRCSPFEDTRPSQRTDTDTNNIDNDRESAHFELAAALPSP